jgi:peptidoglycan/LPS O-acetylase OafA/YrhL
MASAITSTIEPKAMAYRADIDGLRGIAVLLVMAFHFNIPLVSGGYIGVDIFFIISGFLITSLLCLETAVFSPLGNFYRRRIKRLLPMFLVFAVATTLVASLLLLPDDYLNYLRSLYYSLIFQANTHFDGVTKNYFAPNSHELPLLHTWSLSIEWQFYLLFPLLFLLARKWLPSRALIAGVVLLTLVLAAYSWHQTGNSQQAYFYTSARFFELLIGCLAALIKVGPTTKQIRLGVSFTVSVAIALLVGAAFLFNNKTAFPGIPALGVCLLTAIVVVWGKGNQLLESPGLVHVGRISYSAYLWHWPVAAFFAYLQSPIPPQTGIVLLILVLGLAHLSYLWIEKPGRQIQLSLLKLVLCFVVLPAVVVIVFFKVANNHDGFFERLGSESVYIHSKMQPYLDNKKLSCLHFKGEGTDECSFGDITATSSAYLIGDSHAGHYRWFTEVLATQAHLKVTSLAHGECLMLPGASNQFRDAEHDAKCRHAIQKDYNRIKNSRPKYVLIAQRWVGYSFDEVKKLDGAISLLISQGTIPIILGPVAEDGRDLKACFYQHIKLRSQYQGECKIDRQNNFSADEKEKITTLFDEIRKNFPQAIVLNVQDVQCEKNMCDAEIDGVPIYDDTHHINGYGSATLAARYIARYGNPLLTTPADRVEGKPH